MNRPSAGNGFDALRLLAALAVVIEHSVIHLDSSFLWLRDDHRWWFSDGVTAFFLLSGFMVYGSARRCYDDDRPWLDYARNRALRIIPAIYAYFLIALILLLAIGALSGASLASVQGAGFIASHLVLAPVYHPPMLADFGIGVVNGSLWTIPVEVSFYVVVPLLVLLAARFGERRMLTWVAALAFVAVFLHSLTRALWGGEMLWTKLVGVTFVPWLWFFVLGIIAAKTWPRLRHSGWIALGAAFGYFALSLVMKTPDVLGGSHIWRALAAVPLVYVLLWLGNYGPRWLSGMTSRLGDLSFGTYIWHMVVVNLLVEYGAREWSVSGTALISGVAAASLALAWLSWHGIEKPALGRKRYSAMRPRTIRAVPESVPLQAPGDIPPEPGKAGARP